MNTDIQIFENPEFGQIRTIQNEKGDIFFVARDMAMGLGYRDAYTMTRSLDDDEKDTQIVCTLGGDQQMVVITESGFYHAAMISRVEKARKFRKWVTSVVLPQIRKTGGYIPVNEDDNENTILCKALMIILVPSKSPRG